MTLNITAATARCIYQSADYRLVDLTTGGYVDYETQKIQVVTTFRWSATVCFAGVGRTNTVDVATWLEDQLSLIGRKDPFEVLIEKILDADSWLRTVPHPHNRHSFSVGAFIGSRPEFVLISNFQDLTGTSAERASARLMVHRTRPSRPTTYLSGIVSAVTRQERRRLAALASRDPTPRAMYGALADVNEAAARRTRYVSPACFTTHIRLTGEGGGVAHKTEGQILSPIGAAPPEIRDVIQKLIDQQFGPGRGSVTGISFVRAEASDEYHQTQLREKPNDASVHSNYGAYLDANGDHSGAERAYKRALDLDPNHVNALGNLANLCWQDGRNAESELLYRKALANQQGQPNVTWNFARFLDAKGGHHAEILSLLAESIAKHPDDGRLRLLLADLHLLHREFCAALQAYRDARGISSDQAAVERGYAFALQMSGGDVGDCLAAYRLAVTLNNTVPELRLNLAQLLFISGDFDEATQQLAKALQLGLVPSAEVEAQFFRVCHIRSDQDDALTRLETLVDMGARLNWDVTGNVQYVRERDPVRAVTLQQLANVLSSEGPVRAGHIRSLFTA